VPIWNSNKNVKKCEGFLVEPCTIDSLEIWMAKRMFWLQIEAIVKANMGGMMSLVKVKDCYH
jgi:hypothetical protein